MTVLSFAFCRDAKGNFGLVKSFSKGLLTVQFDDGVRHVRPSELTFL